MGIRELIQIIGNRLAFLQSQRTQAVAIGDLPQVASLDAEITETQDTLNKLNTLPG